jgi:hypothetical protein
LGIGNLGKKELEERESKKKDLVAENYDEGEAAMPRQLLELKHEYSLTLDSCLVLTKLQPIKIELLVI